LLLQLTWCWLLLLPLLLLLLLLLQCCRPHVQTSA
jgi:hypothetical protein